MPLIDCEAQAGWARAELIAFDATGPRVAARQAAYRPGVAAERELSIYRDRLLDVLRVKTTDGAVHKLGLVLNLQGTVALPVGFSPTPFPLPYWTDTRARSYTETAAFTVDYGTPRMRVSITAPGHFSVTHGSVPDVPPRRRAALYVELEAPAAEFNTTFEPLQERYYSIIPCAPNTRVPGAALRYAGSSSSGGTMSEATSTSLPRIGDTAPDFTAVTTQHAAMRFSEWQGESWVILFSHPADFTPVCSTELTEFARRAGEFTAMNTKLIGVSVDSIHSHLAWIQNLREKLDVEINYPLVADTDTKVSQLYGMIHPGASATATVRAVFIIDPKRTIRALIYYPMNAGRNIDEILRVTLALQTADQHACALPVNWKPGDKVVVPPPKQMTEVAERLSHADKDYDVKDFYLCLRELPQGAAAAGKK